MESVCIICIIIIVFVMIINLTSSIQGFASKPNTIVLLGDSILKNNKYVQNDKSIEFLLNKYIEKTNIKMIFLAEDDSRISDIKGQITSVIENNAYFVISSGGNDILQYIYTQTLNSTILKHIFNKYTNAINNIITTYKPNKIYLLNLYFPTDISIQPFYKYIHEWNNLLEEYKKSNLLIELLHIDDICNKSSDFVDIIEPSEICSAKIAKKISDIV